MRERRHAVMLPVLLLAWIGLLHAEPIERQTKIDHILSTTRSVGLPHLLGEVLPLTLQYAVREELVKAARDGHLGRDWHPRNPWFERAAELADRASGELAQRIQANPLDWEPAMRASLAAVKGPELDGLWELYRSPAAPRYVELADLTVGMFVLASLETQRKSLGLRPAAVPAMARLSDRVTAIPAELQPEEHDALASPDKRALRTMARVHDDFFRNLMRGLKPEITACREQVGRELAPLIEQYDPLRPAPDDGP
jgi:hypothetical protein